MKGLEKLTSIRLAEVLSQKNLVQTDGITDALFAQDQLGEPFTDVLVSMGRITEWDLAKIVVESFQLPFIMASNYEVSAAAKSKLGEQALFKTLIVPLDLFGEGMAVVMPILTPFETLDKIQREYGVDLFPYVGLISENKKVLNDQFPHFAAWQTKNEEAREARRRAKPKGQSSEWMNIFDTADKAVRSQQRKQ